MMDSVANNFRKIECCCFVPIQLNSTVCGCGETVSNHSAYSLENKLAASNNHRWSAKQNTIQLPTDSYGTIEFHSALYPVKSQYIRLSYDSKPEQIVDLLTKKWGLELPKLVIIVQSGKADFELPSKLKKVIRKGLAKAAKTSGSWIITSGVNSGATKQISDAFVLEESRKCRRIACIGIAPWGIIANSSELVGTNKVVQQYSSVSPIRPNSFPLNNRHSCFLLADNGTRGSYGAEDTLSRNLVKYISTQKINQFSHNRIPVIGVIIEGDLATLKIVLDYLTLNPPIPVVVCNGTGGISDLIAFVHKYTSGDDNQEILKSTKEYLLSTIQVKFSLSSQQSETVVDDLMKCAAKKSLLTIFEMSEECEKGVQNELDQTIVTALFKLQHLLPVEQLSVAIAWNRTDIAIAEVFNGNHNLPRSALYDAMMQSLILDRTEFVKLLLEHGVCMQDFLTIPRLEELYNSRLGPPNVLKYILKDVKSHIPANYLYNLYDIGLVINKLMGGAYRAYYARRKFRSTYAAKPANKSPVDNRMPSFIQNLANINMLTYSNTVVKDDMLYPSNFQYPFNELLIWAVLTKRQNTAMLMWQYGEEVLAKSLIASKLYKAMAIEAAEDDLETEIFEELLKFSNEFETISYQLLDYCYRQDDHKAQQLLTCELTNWSGQTCLSLAVAAENLALLSHPCAQIILADLWLGGLRSRKNTNLKVFLSLIMPLYILNLEFKSKEELQLMPQTEEEYLENESSGDESLSDLSVSYDKNFLSIYATDKGAMFPEDDSNMVHNNFDFKQKHKNKLGLRKRIYEFYTAPITKFWFYALSYLMFLLIYSHVILIKLPKEVTVSEYYILIYLATLLCEKMREIICSEPVKLSKKFAVWTWNMWNPFDAIGILVHFIGFGLRLSPSQMDYGRILYCVDSVYWYLRIFGIINVNKSFGPLVTMMGKMIKKLLYFIVMLFILLLSFGVCRQAIANPREYFEANILREIVLEPYFMIFGETFPETIYPPCGDDPDMIPCRPGRWITPFVMAFYFMSTTVLLMNVIIAYLNYKFYKVNKISHQIWKFQRFSVVMEYEQKPVLPPPLILISHVYLLYKFVKLKMKGVKKQYDNGLKLFLDPDDLLQLYDFEDECVQDYCLEKECLLHQSNEERIRQSLEKIQNTHQKVQNIDLKVNSHIASSQNVDSRLTKLEDTAEQLYTQFNNFHKFMISNGFQPSYKNVARLRRTSESNK